MTTNGHVAVRQASPPPSGCYAPAITFFDPVTDRLDLDAQAKFFSYLASTGLAGLVILGTNAETLLLTREERKALLVTARQSVPTGFPIIAGVSGHSTAQVLEYVADAHDAGSDYLLLLPCAYFGKQTTPEVINNFFDQVARESPLPILLYNFPAVCNGLDMDSEMIAGIAKRNPNVVGVKLTCGSVAKIARLSGTFSPERFTTFGGQADFLLGGLACGSAGCIAAFCNVFPKTVARLYKQWEANKHDESLLQLQQKLALAESPTKAGVAATKYAASLLSAKKAGIENAEALLQPRRPYVPLTDQAKSNLRDKVSEMMKIEEEA